MYLFVRDTDVEIKSSLRKLNATYRVTFFLQTIRKNVTVSLMSTRIWYVSLSFTFMNTQRRGGVAHNNVMKKSLYLFRYCYGVMTS